MKFSLFVHMERTAPEKSHSELFSELETLVKIAEDGGMETAWIGEHHCMEFTIAPNPFINIAYLGAKTKRIRLGTGTVVAPFWHPLRLAGEAALADLACQGRLDLGIARGAYQFEYERLSPGLDAMEAGKKMREMVPLLPALWKGDVTHEGEFWRFPSSTSVPKPVQSELPVWVAARDPNSHAFAVANGCNVQVTPLAAGDEEVESLMERFNQACQNSPDVPRPDIMLLMHGYVAENEKDTEAAVKDLAKFYCYFESWFQNKAPIKNGFIEALSEEHIASHPRYTPENMKKNLVVGTPDEVIERIRGYEKMGYDQFSFWIDSLMPFERKKASLERFVRDVMPAFAA
ncbi:MULTISPECIES: LLM class flavin-dependent oxidoreductase [Acetobacter]|uniref:LLM class flavin-dependent oxidoreductase n=1 Tax=Acetobacter thailandicus TaxID=1502842 RepID=A0ABT3QC05_9PROT|nr:MULTISPECIES: LLM class flavin-dependent oxidoreductase [Acetobacter]MBS0958999.1 LLM class flavin-dependent oxidoreductase [Acetobacter thailandicus]MBS0980353.1 LLM class flavin-dependent oxidoreductase [Acetobacter thailandicus]MBS0985114.1 LLM class flavin-dependent oxidoreductase [Acetobacter thailandicus]MBS1003347.1 LLM class flavin-dependent oxidoreductase [Acetobacter thailandicus]MCX2562818.1 LLM class flavin-dependent oxidoreductase [Acetobacter thailandicus]